MGEIAPPQLNNVYITMGGIMARKVHHDLDEVTDGSNTEHLMHEMGLQERFETGCLQITVDTPPEQWPTSLEKGTREWQSAVINAQCTPDVNIGNDWSEVFLVRDWLVMIRESIDEKTGEIKRYPWLALFCVNGDIVGTSSEVAPHQFARALRTVPPEEWKQGVPFKIRRRPNRAGDRSYHEIRVAY